MLRIATDLSLPLDTVTQAIGILARRGAGKTHTASVLVEEVIGAHLPVVVLDPTGAWWGLRTSANGDKPGLPVVIFGGEHGDVPLERGAGKAIADVIVEHPGAYVIDLSGFESKTAELTFAADFLERLYRAKASARDALLVVVDEADTFAPQRPGNEQTRTLGALEAVVRRGRIRGLGVVLITQRSAVLNKNVLTQIEVLVAMQTTGPQDRAAIDEWVKGNGSPEERDAVMGSLASLERGEAWVWSPSWLRILQRVRIRARTTYDSSKTPEAGAVAVEPRAFAKVDLERLGKRIADAIEKGKADDPRELRRRIQQLESESAARLAVIERRQEPETIVERVEVPVLNGQVPELRIAIGELVDAGQRLVEVATAVGDAAAVIQSAAGAITTAIDRASSAPRTAQQVATPVATARGTAGRLGAPTGAAVPRTRGTEPATTRDPARQAAVGAPTLGRGERTVLTAVAQYPSGAARDQLTVLTGYKRSSRDTYLQRLSAAGYVEPAGGGSVRATEAGIAALGSDYEPLPQGPELQAYWRERLPEGERRVLDVLIGAYPVAVRREQIDEETGYRRSSRDTYLQRLRSRRLVEIAGPAEVRASGDLFA